MSADQPCTDCAGAATTTRAERALAIVGLFAGTVIAYMAVDIMTGGRISAGLTRLFGGGSARALGRDAETYLRAGQHDRHG